MHVSAWRAFFKGALTRASVDPFASTRLFLSDYCGFVRILVAFVVAAHVRQPASAALRRVRLAKRKLLKAPIWNCFFCER
jgi:hypothetical protein